MYFRFLRKVQKYNSLQIILTRYLLYGFGLIDILFLPKLLSLEVYGGIEYYKNIIFLFPNILLGASSGYIFVYYVEKRDEFDSFFKISFLISFVIAIIVGFLLNDYFIILPLISINFFTVFEQKLKVKRNFTEAFLFKPLLSTSVLCICLLGVTLDSEKSIIFLMFTFTSIIWFIIIKKKVNIRFKLPNKKDYYVYIQLIKRSIAITLCSATLSLLIFSERFFVELFYPNQLPSYSFAFNLSQIMVILISAFSYVSTIEHGEQLNLINKNGLVKTLRKSIWIYIFINMLYIILVYVISQFYKKFDNLLVLTLIITLSKGFNTFVGIFSPIAVFKDYNKEMLKTILFISIINVVISYYLAIHGYSLTFIMIIDSILIILYSCYILDIVFRRIRFNQ